MSSWASERYNLTAAPGSLALVQDFLNTVGRRGEQDLLNEFDSARSWFEAATRSWSLDNADILQVPPSLTEGELTDLRVLRDTLRVALLHRDDEDASSQWRLEGSLKLQINGSGRVLLEPTPSRSARIWLINALSLEMYKAQLVGTFARFKLCANQWCLMAFYDRSKNSSGVWHDVRTCGNEHNLRVSRARKAAARREQSLGLDASASA